MKTFVLSALIFSFAILSGAHALDAAFLETSPAAWKFSEDSQEVEISFEHPDLIRARLLLPGEHGLKAIPLDRQGDKFTANFSLENTSYAHYKIQVQGTDGYRESEFFKIPTVESEIDGAELARLKEALESESAKVAQLKLNLHSIKVADTTELSKNKNQEFARALVILGQKERELKELEGAK